MMEKIDVLINVFSKPWQTALSLLSLLEHSGQHIDKIYFQEEPARSSFEKKSQATLLHTLQDRIVHFSPAHWLGVDPTDQNKLQDRDYRLSMRYQQGFEESDKRYVLTIHNDIVVHADIVGYLRSEVGEYSGVGHIGQCWWCPAHQHKLCTSASYEDYRPDFETLHQLYAQEFEPTARRAYHYGWGEQFKEQPWPLPECRLNEWCALIDRHKTVPDTLPQGRAAPLGAQMPSGACIGENFDEPVNLDTGVQWFRDLCHLGHRFKHVELYAHVRHDSFGHSALLHAETYIAREMQAKQQVLALFPAFGRV